MVKKYNLSKPEKYMKDGAEKTYWANVGTLTEFTKQDGSIFRIVEIPAIGLKASVFEIQPKANGYNNAPASKPAQPATDTSTGIDYPAEEINPEDIPF